MRARAAPGAAGSSLFQCIEIENGVGDIRPHRRHLVGAQDIPLRQLHDAAALREAREARLDEALAGQAVQHHVDSGPVRRVENFPGERGRAAVEHVHDAERAEISLLARARGCEHLRTCSLRQLDGGESHAAGAGVKREPARQARGPRDRRKGPPRRTRSEIVASAVAENPAGAGATSSSRITASAPNVPNPRPTTRSPAETVETSLPVSSTRPHISRPSRPVSRAPTVAQHVPEVEARSPHLHAHLSGLERARRQWLDGQVFEWPHSRRVPAATRRSLAASAAACRHRRAPDGRPGAAPRGRRSGSRGRGTEAPR